MHDLRLDHVCLAAGVERIARIECRAHCGSLLPIRTDATGQAVELGGKIFELLGVLPLRIDFEQLDVDRMARRLVLQRVKQDLLGLRITAVGHVNVCLGHRVHTLVGIDCRHGGLTEVRLDLAAGVDTLATRGAKNRIAGMGRRRDRRCAQRIVGGGRTVARAHEPPTQQQRQQAAAANQRGRIVEQFAEEPRRRRRFGCLDRGLRCRLGSLCLGWLGLDFRCRLLRRLGRLHGFRRFRNLGRFHRLRCFYRLGRLHRFCRFSRLRRLHGLRRGRWLYLGRRLPLRRCSLLLNCGQILVFQLDEFLQLVYVLLQFRRARIGILERTVLRDEILLELLRFLVGFGVRFAIFGDLGLRDLDLILTGRCNRRLLFDFRCNLPGRNLLGCLGRRCRLGSRSKLAAIGVEVGDLGADDLARFRCRDRCCSLAIRNAQNLAGLEPVHVSVKGILVPVVERDQHLVDRNPLAGKLPGNLGQRVAAFYRVAVAGKRFGALPARAGRCRTARRGGRLGASVGRRSR